MMRIESFLQSRYICLFAIASVTFSFLHLLSLFVNDRNKRGRGSVGPRMDENVPYLPTEKVDQLQKVCGDIEFAVYKCLQEEWGVLEKSPEAALDVDQTIFKLLQQEDLLALRPSSCSACLLQ
ncbi:BnaA08g05850D [Brassica napus]|uniref:BnaA08g05850D protein n=1 Tax=Brassica napus TaxID=3708 RepID=A0A078G8H9_BRANA|nr:BnaA08g05850D [Brassica napus]